MKNLIGINTNQATELITKLNDLLANYQVYYQNLRGFHWNISGPEFFELHVKFEELYTEANLNVDELAERILTLGGTPLHTYSDYFANSEIAEVKNATTGRETVSATLSNLGVLIEKEREIMRLASTSEDEGTASMISDYIIAQEKVIWMLAAYLKK